MSKYINKKNWNKSIVSNFIRDLKNDQKISDWWKIDFEELESEMNQYPNLDFKSACLLSYNAYSKVHGRDVNYLGDKNPEYSLHIPKLLKTFPGSKFVIMVRDPIDNIESYMNVNFDLNNKLALAARWNFYNRRLIKANKLFPNQTRIVKFEDLIKQPESTIKSICNFLEINFDSEMLDFYKSSKNVFEWNKQIKQSFNPESIEKWKKRELTIVDKKISRLTNDLIQHFGYETRAQSALGILDWIQYLYGITINRLELIYYRLPISVKNIILKLYRRITKTF